VNRFAWPLAFLSNQGSVLVEVLVALVLLGLLIVPLASGLESAVGRTDALRTKSQKVSDAFSNVDGAESWDWGPAVWSAQWRSGPTLGLKIVAPSGSDPVIGVWVDGWFLGERSPDAGGSVCLQASELSDLSGRELVVRVREEESVWGPPWRSLVPDASGESFSSEAATQADFLSQDANTAEKSVAHAPALANPRLEISWRGAALEADLAALLFALPTSTAGRCEAALDEQRQSWWAEAGRALDLYF
jgi:hypothetical protein